MTTQSGKAITALMAAKRAFVMLGEQAMYDIDDALSLAFIDLKSCSKKDKIEFMNHLKALSKEVRKKFGL